MNPITLNDPNNVGRFATKRILNLASILSIISFCFGLRTQLEVAHNFCYNVFLSSEATPHPCVTNPELCAFFHSTEKRNNSRNMLVSLRKLEAHPTNSTCNTTLKKCFCIPGVNMLPPTCNKLMLHHGSAHHSNGSLQGTMHGMRLAMFVCFSISLVTTVPTRS